MPSYIYSFLYPTNKTVYCFNLKNVFKKHGLLNGKNAKMHETTEPAPESQW